MAALDRVQRRFATLQIDAARFGFKLRSQWQATDLHQFELQGGGCFVAIGRKERDQPNGSCVTELRCGGRLRLEVANAAAVPMRRSGACTLPL